MPVRPRAGRPTGAARLPRAGRCADGNDAAFGRKCWIDGKFSRFALQLASERPGTGSGAQFGHELRTQRRHVFANVSYRLGDDFRRAEFQCPDGGFRAFCVRLETTTTGIGRNAMSRSRKSSPSMRGISMSSVMTSGERLDTLPRDQRIRRCSNHLKFAVSRNMSESNSRMSAESSTIST